MGRSSSGQVSGIGLGRERRGLARVSVLCVGNRYLSCRGLQGFPPTELGTFWRILLRLPLGEIREAIYAPIDPWRAGRGRDGRGRRPVVRLWRSSVRSLSTPLCYPSNRRTEVPAEIGTLPSRGSRPLGAVIHLAISFFCLLRAPLLQERFFLLQYRPLSRQADREKEP